MSIFKTRVLFEKGLLPICVDELCKIVGEGARWENLSPDTIITCLSYLGSFEPLHEGFLAWYISLCRAALHVPFTRTFTKIPQAHSGLRDFCARFCRYSSQTLLCVSSAQCIP